MSRNIEYVPYRMYMNAIRTCKEMENLLIQYMGEEAYHKWSTGLAKELFAAELNDMEDSDFKQFCIENFENITNIDNGSTVVIDMTQYEDEDDE